MIQSIAGLSVSLLGTILVALSVKKGKVRAYMDSPDEMEQMASFKHGLLVWGLVLLGSGFLLQIWAVATQ